MKSRPCRVSIVSVNSIVSSYQVSTIEAKMLAFDVSRNGLLLLPRASFLIDMLL